MPVFQALSAWNFLQTFYRTYVLFLVLATLFLLLSTLLITLCKHSFHLFTAKVEIIYLKDFILYSQIVFVIVLALIIGVQGCAFILMSYIFWNQCQLHAFVQTVCYITPSACMGGLIFHSHIITESLKCTGNTALLYHPSAVCRDDIFAFNRWSSEACRLSRSMTASFSMGCRPVSYSIYGVPWIPPHAEFFIMLVDEPVSL